MTVEFNYELLLVGAENDAARITYEDKIQLEELGEIESAIEDAVEDHLIKLYGKAPPSCHYEIHNLMITNPPLNTVIVYSRLPKNGKRKKEPSNSYTVRRIFD